MVNHCNQCVIEHNKHSSAFSKSEGIKDNTKKQDGHKEFLSHAQSKIAYETLTELSGEFCFLIPSSIAKMPYFLMSFPATYSCVVILIQAWVHK